MSDFSIIVALDEQKGIGKDGGLPWHLKADLQHFKTITTKTADPQQRNVVIMGRKTWESLPERFRPLPDRVNVVLTRDSNYPLPEGVFRAGSLDQAFSSLKGDTRLFGDIDSFFVIGGQQIFEEAMKRPQCQHLYCTHIEGDFQCDTFFPDFQQEFQLIETSSKLQEGALSYQFSLYKRTS